MAWTMAWDRYAVAAAILKQMPYAVAMEHKEKVHEVAVDGTGEGFKPFLGVLFDEVSRFVGCSYFILAGRGPTSVFA